MTPKQKIEIREQITMLLQTDYGHIDILVNQLMSVLENAVLVETVNNPRHELESTWQTLRLLVHACKLKELIPLTQGLCSSEYTQTAEQLYRESIQIARNMLGE